MLKKVSLAIALLAAPLPALAQSGAGEPGIVGSLLGVVLIVVIGGAVLFGAQKMRPHGHYRGGGATAYATSQSQPQPQPQPQDTRPAPRTEEPHPGAGTSH